MASTRHAEKAQLGHKHGPSLTDTASESVPVAKKSKKKAVVQTKLSGFMKTEASVNTLQSNQLLLKYADSSYRLITIQMI